MNIMTMLLALSMLCSASLFAAESAPPAVQKKAKRNAQFNMRPMSDRNLRVKASAKYLELSGSADFIAGDAMQVNYVTGSGKDEPKKTGFILNILPVLLPDGKRVDVQVQVELSGPSKEGSEASTWQWQSAFSLERGKKTVLVDGEARFEMTID